MYFVPNQKQEERKTFGEIAPIRTFLAANVYELIGKTLEISFKRSSRFMKRENSENSETQTIEI